MPCAGCTVHMLHVHLISVVERERKRTTERKRERERERERARNKAAKRAFAVGAELQNCWSWWMLSYFRV